VAFDGGGAASPPRELHGRVRALLDVGSREGGAPLWCVATDMGEVEVVGGSGASDAVRTLRALAKLLCDADGRPRPSRAQLFLLHAAAADALALVDGAGFRVVGVAAGGALELRATDELPVREAAALPDPAGDRLVLALDGGRVRVVDANGVVTADFACGEVRRAGGRPHAHRGARRRRRRAVARRIRRERRAPIRTRAGRPRDGVAHARRGRRRRRRNSAH